MVKKYIIRLSEEERSLLRDIVKKLKGTSQKVRRANILLKADVDGPNWSDAKIAEAFEAKKARELVRRIEFHYTPKHGSWLNIAENELSSMTRQSISGRRIENIEMLRAETSAWAVSSNEKQRGVDWQFTVENARVKLKSLYPNL